jgi:L-rhamnose mutarotase
VTDIANNTMKQIAFKMKLRKGFEQEYKRRHDEIGQELKDLLHSKSISDYYIFLDEATGDLFGTLKIEDEQKLEELPQHPVMQRWWAFMKDIMETAEDNSPVSIPLQQVFYLP